MTKTTHQFQNLYEFQKGSIDILSQLTCVEKENEILYVFWHALNGHLQCKHQQTSKPEKKKIKKENYYNIKIDEKKIKYSTFKYGNSQFLGMEFLVILLDPKNQNGSGFFIVTGNISNAFGELS